jgi:site-specific DNA-cytosine methylase
MSRTILDLCSGTGNWSEPYVEDEYEVIRVELKDGQDARLWPSTSSTTNRLPSDFNDIRPWVGKIHGILAAPECTVFSAAGSRWPRSDEDITDGLSLLDACLRLVHVLQPKWWVLENPKGKITRWLGNPIHTFDPFYFGDPYSKKTLLWGDFNMPKPSLETIVAPHKGSLPQSQKDVRSATPAGFAKAFKEVNP